MKKYCIILLSGFIACTSSSKINTAEKTTSSPEFIKAKQKISTITIAEYNNGQKLYVQDCKGCHTLKNPSKFTLEQWEPILKRMFVKAKVGDTLSRTLIRQYVISRSK